MLPKRGAVHAGVLEAGAHDSIQYCDHERIKLRLKARAKPGEVPAEKHHLVGGMATIQLLGVSSKPGRFNIDDFGTGYSSITYLRNHGVDKLKIDRSFTAQLGQNEEIDSIVRSIIDLGRAMRIVVAAEGVETEDQRELLSEMGCNQLQGFLLSHPLTPEKLELMLQRWLPSKAREA